MFRTILLNVYIIFIMFLIVSKKMFHGRFPDNVAYCFPGKISPDNDGAQKPWSIVSNSRIVMQDPK